MIDLFRSYGHVDIDTARVYGDGSSESFLGQLNLAGVNLDTKLFPSAANPAIAAVGTPYHHNAQDLRLGLMRSLEALQVPKVHVWYLHSPDRTVPFEDTLREVNDLHQEGYFENLGISNYQSWELAKLCEISERNGWIKPSVCQGIYNAFHRAVEPELLRCLRHYGISFYCFNPLAASLLTSRYSRDKPEATAGGGGLTPEPGQELSRVGDTTKMCILTRWRFSRRRINSSTQSDFSHLLQVFLQLVHLGQHTRKAVSAKRQA